MFADSFMATMAIQILFFVGLLVVFFSLARGMSAHGEETREALRKQQMYLADLEKQLMEMNFVLRRLQGGEEEPRETSETGGAAREIPVLKSRDELLSMLEKAAQTSKGTSPIGDLLLPPPTVARPLAEEYDPSSDPHLFDDSILTHSLNRKSGSRGGENAGDMLLPPLRRGGR
ncbi:MAG: hypothetical protein LBN33_03275 [Desulfovibrio sp.]|nr:hypothetical protein [Desulfovibrio sp.]